MTNPLTQIQFQIPFDRINASQVVPAIDQLLKESQSSLDELIENHSAPDYQNTLAALERVDETLEYAMGIVGHLESVATYPELREAYNHVQPLVSAFYSSIPLNKQLWQRIQACKENDQSQGLSPTCQRFLNKTVDQFRRSGSELNPEDKKRLLDINVELAQVTTKFAENVLDSTNAFELYIENEAGLTGLPPSAVAAATASAASKGNANWRFTLQAPSYIAVMTYLDDPDVRRKMYEAYSTRATKKPFDNKEIILNILALRKEKAQLLGYDNFADLVLEDRMAKTGSTAWEFVNTLREKTQSAFEQENKELESFSGQNIEPWDLAYLAEKLRTQQYAFNEEDLRPYFPYEGVLKGMFKIVERLFGIQIQKCDGVPAWNKAVDTYQILDSDGSHLGSYYADYFPREDKRDGAWMDALITGEPNGDGFTPHLGVNCGNLTPPINGKLALLTHREVETIFHEFGHLLHHLLSRVEVKSLAGTQVAWDWVELPSQIMENWCWEREALDIFARHYETGSPLPEDLYSKMKRAKNFRSANAQMRQLSFATLDLALHTKFDSATDGDVLSYSWSILTDCSPVPLPEDHAMAAAFTHLFASPVGYGAGYYSYKWSEMLDADAFTRFAKEGIFNPDTGRAFREHILSKGNSEDPEILFQSFMGRDPDPEALMKRLDLTA